MSKIKSIFVTALVASMLGLILCGLFVLKSPAFGVLVAILAAFGAAHTTVNFYHWLRKTPPLLPATAPKKKPKQKKAGALAAVGDPLQPVNTTHTLDGNEEWLSFSAGNNFEAAYDEIKAEIINEN